MSKTKIIYQDIAVGAAEDATVTASGATAASSVERVPFGLTTEEPIFATLEMNRWALDGNRETMGGASPVFWSEDISGADCSFSSPPTVQMSFADTYSSVGLTIQFGQGEWCSGLSVSWYNGAEKLAEMAYTPNTNSFFCEKLVAGYNKIVISLTKTAMPYRRARVNQVQFGLIREFDFGEIRSAVITGEMSLSGLELPESSLSWTLESRGSVDFMFQTRQAVQVEHDASMIGTYYITKANRSADRTYSIKCRDAFGVLGDVQYPGSAHLGGVSALALLTGIVDGAFEIVNDCADVTLTGVLKAMTKREAVQQVLFAWGVNAAVTGDGKIHIFQPPTAAQPIPEDRIYQGGKVETAAIVTAVKVTSHAFTLAENGSTEINGVRYNDARTVFTVDNPAVSATDKANVVTVENATLVSSSNVQAVANRLYDHCMKRDTYNGNIVWDGESLGDCLSLPNAWGGTHTGHLQRYVMTLSNTIKANCKSLGV